MHIEAPEEQHHAQYPFASLKDFIFHILTISLGLGLALAAEAAVEYYHHRELAEETREFFHSQSEENQKAVTAHIKATETDREAIEKALALVNNNDLPAARAAIMQSAHQFIELNTGSWDPAVATGALNYMGLAEVQRYSRIHVSELALNKLIHENEDVWFAMSEYNEGASEVDKDDVRAVKRLLRKARTYANQIALREEALLKMYEGSG